MAKYAVVAFLLWLVGSFVGLHHLYLHRPHAAFLSFVTLQGCGVLWFYDLLTIPQLVSQANSNAEYVARLRVTRTFCAQPPLSLLASLVQISTGTLFGTLATCLLPAHWPPILYEVLFATGASWGITFSGDAVDRDTSGKWKYVYGTVLAVVVSAFVYHECDVDKDAYRSAKTAAIFLGVAVYLLTRRWSERVDELLRLLPQDQDAVGGERAVQDSHVNHAKKVRSKPAYWKTLLTYWTLLAAFVAGGLTAVQFHGVIRMEGDGVVTETPFFEACGNFLRSEAFATFRTTMYDLYQGKSFDEQFQDRWQRFNAKMDLSGRHRYLQTLGLPRNASEKEIKTAYRTLVLQWHPDKYTGDDREYAGARFLEIQEAYEKLVGLQADRSGAREQAFEARDEL